MDDSSEREALRIVQNVAAALEALATLTLANQIHMQQLKGELEDLRNDLDRVNEEVWREPASG